MKDRLIGAVVREVRKALYLHNQGVSVDALKNDLEEQTGREWQEDVLDSALLYLQYDEAECRDGLWFPEANWARRPD